jgi:cell division protease FtsH
LHSPGMDDWQQRHYGELTADAIDAAVRRLIDDAFSRAQGILAANKPLLLETAAVLLAKETLSEDELKPFAARLVHSNDALNAPAPVALVDARSA